MRGFNLTCIANIVIHASMQRPLKLKILLSACITYNKNKQESCGVLKSVLFKDNILFKDKLSWIVAKFFRCNAWFFMLSFYVGDVKKVGRAMKCWQNSLVILTYWWRSLVLLVRVSGFASIVNTYNEIKILFCLEQKEGGRCCETS